MNMQTNILSFEESLYDVELFSYLSKNGLAYFIKDGDIYVAVPKSFSIMIKQHINYTFKKSTKKYKTISIFYDTYQESWIEKRQDENGNVSQVVIMTMIDLDSESYNKTFTSRSEFFKWYHGDF